RDDLVTGVQRCALQICVNGLRMRKGQMVRRGDSIAVPQLRPAILEAQADLVVRVVYEDDAIIAVDKPVGMPSHGLSPSDRNTVEIGRASCSERRWSASL